jgi:hypothetical protein
VLPSASVKDCLTEAWPVARPFELLLELEKLKLLLLETNVDRLVILAVRC